MATLWVNDGYRKDFDKKINSYKETLSEISTQYTDGYKKISSYSGDSNVSTVNTYLNKRKKDLTNKMSEADDLRTAVNNYVDAVLDADLDLGNKIHADSYSLYASEHVGPQADTALARAWNKVCTTVYDFAFDFKAFVNNAVQDIKEFYEKYKYVFDVLLDILEIAAAIALLVALPFTGGLSFLGIMCLLGGFWALSKAMYNTCADIQAVQYWIEGDEAAAERASNSTLSGVILDGANWLDEKVGGRVFGTIASGLLIGLEICEFTARMVVIFESVKDLLNLKLRCDGKMLKTMNPLAKGRSFKQSLHDLSWIKFWGTKGNGLRLGSITNVFKAVFFAFGFDFNKKAKNFGELIKSTINPKNKAKVKEIYSNPSSIGKGVAGSKETSGVSKNIFDIIWHQEEYYAAY